MGNESAMLSFLNALLSEDYGKITHLTFENTEPPKHRIEQRGVTFDLRCILENGDEVIVEMQNYAHKFFQTRANYYLYKLMDKHIPQGVIWSKMTQDIPRLIGVFILGIPITELDDVVTQTAECDIKKSKVIWDRMRKYYISLPHFNIHSNTHLSLKDIWLETIKNLGNMVQIDPHLYEVADDALLELIEKAKVSALSKEEYSQYEAELKALSNEGTAEAYGFQRGIHETAIRMLQYGESIDKIILFTGLSIEELHRLKNNI